MNIFPINQILSKLLIITTTLFFINLFYDKSVYASSEENQTSLREASITVDKYNSKKYLLIEELLTINNDNWDSNFELAKKNSIEQFQGFLTRELSVTLLNIPTSKQSQAQQLLNEAVMEISSEFEPIIDDYVSEQLVEFDSSLEQAYLENYSLEELQELIELKKNPVLVKDTHITLGIYENSNQSLAQIGQIIQDDRLTNLGQTAIEQYLAKLEYLVSP